MSALCSLLLAPALAAGRGRDRNGHHVARGKSYRNGEGWGDVLQILLRVILGRHGRVLQRAGHPRRDAELGLQESVQVLQARGPAAEKNLVDGRVRAASAEVLQRPPELCQQLADDRRDGREDL